jgi:hypothetical protein
VADVALKGLPSDAVVEQFQMFVTYDHNVLELYQADPNGTLTLTWGAPTIAHGDETDTISFVSSVPLGTSGVLSHLLFKTFVTDTTGTAIAITSTLPGTESGCPTIFSAPIAMTVFQGKELCGDSLMRNLMEGKEIRIEDIHVTGGAPTHVQLDIDSPNAQDVTLTIVDILGRTIWQKTVHVTAGTTTFNETIDLPSGAYILRMEGKGRIQSRAVLVGK